MNIKRRSENPFLIASPNKLWEAHAAFNPCVVQGPQDIVLLYRAMSKPLNVSGVNLSQSSIGFATSIDGIHFQHHRQFIKPEHHWEIFGCEDPRVTKLDDKYYIFYTALSTYPFAPGGIKIGMAITKDFEILEAKHLVTTFNSKAMALFPEKINGKYAAILTVHTDMPPAKIAIAWFDNEEQLWSEQYWNEWYASLDHHVIPLLRHHSDHLEVGAPPIKTEAGWLLIYSYISNYLTPEKQFGIEMILLDLDNPLKVIGRSQQALMVPEKSYEISGQVPNVIFPSGALIKDKKLYIYYGGADSSCCVATTKLKPLLKELTQKTKLFFIASKIVHGFKRCNQNPILMPRPEFSWEAKATFNPAVIYEAGRFHMIYRAMSYRDTSVWGYASSVDGIHFDERSIQPIYFPREIFEKKQKPGNSGCEDPRITKLDDRFYVFYTAYDGYVPRVAFTSISVSDFLKHWWNWTSPTIISSSSIADKNACLLPEKINGYYVIFHRVDGEIYIDFVNDLAPLSEHQTSHKLSLPNTVTEPCIIKKVGIAAPPIKIKEGWLLFYHTVLDMGAGQQYVIGAAILDASNLTSVLANNTLLLEPEMSYEKIGQTPNVIFPCGAVLLDKEVFLYYGSADTTVSVAKITLKEILKKM